MSVVKVNYDFLDYMAKNKGDSVFNINSLPEEILLKIFKYLSQNELGKISRVCQRWNEYIRSPVLWNKVDVKFSWHGESQNAIVSFFSERLCSSLTYLKLDFGIYHWKGELNFEQLCQKLKERCPRLHTLVFHYAEVTESFSFVIDLCSEFLPNVKVLILPNCCFGQGCRENEYDGFSKIEILDVSQCEIRSNSYSFSKLHYLKKLNLSQLSPYYDRWDLSDNDVSFLSQLEMLRLFRTQISSRTFCILQKHAVSLTELCLCLTRLRDEDFNINHSVFPQLKTICLVYYRHITCRSIISLLKYCPSVQHVYVDINAIEHYTQDPFFVSNPSKMGIVKKINRYDMDEFNSYKKHFGAFE